MLYEVITGEKVFPVNGGAVFSGMEVATIMPLSESAIIIGTLRNGLYLWDMQTFKKWDVNANSLLTSVNIFCGTKYNDNYFVFGTIQGGMVVVDNQGNIVMQIDKDKGLINNTVLSVFVDRDRITSYNVCYTKLLRV